METDAIKRHFQIQVPEYASLMQRLIPFYDAQRNLMLRLIQLGRDAPMRLLDLGCGPGLMAARVFAEFPHAQLTLFDLTQEMMDACRSRLGSTNRVIYRVGDFRTDDFGNGYDVVLASLSLHHARLSERPMLASRLYRCLAPGGRLIAAEIIVDESATIRQQQYELWRRFMDERGEDGDSWYQKHVAKDHPVEISGWTKTLEDAGFASAGCFWRCLNFAIIAANKVATNL
jgi:tRNA (cmo5U34)-methyltransferase